MGEQTGETVPGIRVTGTYMGVFDQRIALSILRIGTSDADSGVVGVDDVLVGWSSIFRPRQLPSKDFRALESGSVSLDSDNVGRPLQLVISNPLGGPPDTVNAAGLRVTFESGEMVRKGWSAVFDVEDFEGFLIWRWLTDPTVEPVAVARYNKPEDSSRPDADWPGATPAGTGFTFVDRFVIDGNVYHYAIQTFDWGFNTLTGTRLNLNEPFLGPLPPAGGLDEPGPTQIRVEYVRVQAEESQWSRVKLLYRE